MQAGFLDKPTTGTALALTVVWMGAVLVKPQLATSPRIAITLNLLSAMLFFLYVTEDPDLTSTRRYTQPPLPAVSGKTVGVTFLALMACVYLWLTWTMAGHSTTA